MQEALTNTYREIDVLRIRLEMAEMKLAEAAEHQDTAPHAGCTCALCTAVSELETLKDNLLSSQVGREAVLEEYQALYVKWEVALNDLTKQLRQAAGVEEKLAASKRAVTNALRRERVATKNAARYKKQLEKARTENMKLRNAITIEPELPGELPDELWQRISSDRAVATKVFQDVVRLTKREIVARATSGYLSLNQGEDA